jgi:hypothetical protein
MRPITFIYVEKIKHDQLEEEQEKWLEADFEYVPFHYMFDFTAVDPFADNLEENEYVIKGRPLSMNNGLIRDAFISIKGIGFLTVLADDEIPNEIYKLMGNFIKQVIIDLGIENYQLVSNFYEKDKKLDTIKLHSAIEEAVDKFLKIRS